MAQGEKKTRICDTGIMTKANNMTFSSTGCYIIRQQALLTLCPQMVLNTAINLRYKTLIFPVKMELTNARGLEMFKEAFLLSTDIFLYKYFRKRIHFSKLKYII